MSYTVTVLPTAASHATTTQYLVETGEDGPETGRLFHVIGDIQSGMTFENKAARKPEESATFVSKEQIGSVTHSDYAQILPICQIIPPPKKQFDRPKRLYRDEPLRRCQEWSSEAIKTLTDAQILQL